MHFPKPKNWWKFYLGAVLINGTILVLFSLHCLGSSFLDLLLYCGGALIVALPIGLGIYRNQKNLVVITGIGNVIATLLLLPWLFIKLRPIAGMVSLYAFYLAALIWFVLFLIGLLDMIFASLVKRKKAKSL